MPLVTTRTNKSDGGRRSVTYRDSFGRTWDALIIGPGTNSGVKLRRTSRKGPGPESGASKDDVALATDLHQTNVYFNRLI